MKRLLFIFPILFIFFCSCKKGDTDVKDDEAVLPEQGGVFTKVGAQLTAITLQGGAFAQDLSGNEYAYTVVSGKPGHLICFDMQSNKVIADMEILGADGSIAMVMSTDKWLYVAGSNARLYRTRPGSNVLEDLGQVLSGQTTILDLVSGKDGEVFGGTFPGCRVFRYHPEGGFSDVGNGPVVTDESYVRSLVYQASSNRIYAGVGSHARLVEIDLITNSKKEILPQSYWNQEFIYSMGLVSGYADGDRLLAWVTSPNQRETLVYNLKTGKIEQVLVTIDAHSAIKSPSSNLSYYTSANKLYSHDLTQPTKTAVALTDCYEAKDMRWGKDGSLHILTRYAQVRRYDSITGNISTIKFDVPPQPYNIQSIVNGPDGRIWSSGYLAGGNAAYDPVTDKVTQYSGLGQAEGMTVQGNNIYFGIYPASSFYVYDTKRPWNVSTGNPKLIGKIEGQDRPFAGVSIENKGKLFFGTVPGYGKLGGALIEYSVSTNQLETYLNVVPNQSIVSLVYAKGLVFGGTTISGGLGISPSEKEAKLFAWDVSTKSKIFEVVPVPGAWAITSLINGLDGNLWGMADGTIFVFDPVLKKVISSHKYYDIGGTPTHIWRNAFLEFHTNGNLYATFNGKFYKIDPKTMKETLLKDGLGILTMDKRGHFYTREAHDLWRYRP